MTDEDEQIELEETEGEQAKPKGHLKLFGGGIGLVGLGTMMAVMATPSKEAPRNFIGPGEHMLFQNETIVGNPLDGNFKRLVRFTPTCVYFAYDLGYPATRWEDEHYESLLKETMQLTISEFRMDEVMGSSTREMFSAALEHITEPILFPVHIGMTANPYDIESRSGLRLGESQERHGTFRGAFYDHVLKVNEREKTLQIDDGAVTSFQGGETDLPVEADDGSKLFVDVSQLKSGFEGDVHVGVMGRIRRVLTGDIIAQ